MSSAEDYGSGRGQGGIALFWRNRIKGISVVSDIILDRACAIRLQTPLGGVMYFISVYLPAMGCSESLDSSLDDITEVIESRDEGAKVVLMGDFNGDIGSSGGPRGYRVATNRGEKVMNFFRRHKLVPMNMQQGAVGPVDTYEGQVNGSTLDYIAVPAEICHLVTECHVHEWSCLNTSDHAPVSAAILVKGLSFHDCTVKHGGHIKWGKMSRYDKYSRYQCVLEPLIATIIATFNESGKTGVAIDGAFTDLTDAIQKVAKTLPHSVYKKHLKPYWSKELTTLKGKKVASYNRWVLAGRPRNHDNALFLEYKADKKVFQSTIRRLSKEYENRQILEAVRSAEVNRNHFWKLVNTGRKNQIRGVSAIKRHDKVVVHEIGEVLDVWADHFLRIGTPQNDDKYDEDHFRNISTTVRGLNDLHDVDDFLYVPFSSDDVFKAIHILHPGKAPGYDGIMSEHLSFAGPLMVDLLCILFNAIRVSEYIPQCFKLGVQVPLYKGKDTCVLDPNNYRGITLLPVFNKLFEVLIWNRLKPWWYGERVISDLQGACKPGSSCVHTAFNLRETLATSMEASDKCFVAFFDVAKAFDTVWIDGLFKQLHDLGITGRTWRLLYRGYINFKCCVKLCGDFSKWNKPQCGIHQGGFMSLMKYTVFINSLLVNLKNSGICCKLYRTPRL